MGGSAFSAFLPASAFPRLPRPVYRALKTRYLPKLAELYAWVGVPTEAPEKQDHGDLDLLVCMPKPPHSSFIPHEVLKRAIGAEHVIAMDGNRTSNYAVPIQPGEWSPFGNASEEEEKRSTSEDRKIYYQVDVHVCENKDEWDRVIFFHSYGDLGMMLGLLVKNNGLALGAKGLKLPDPPNQPFELSTSFDDITQFLGLSLATFYNGFKTKREVFEWVASMKYFDARHFRSSGPGISKVKAERTMYAEFVEWIEQTKPLSGLHTGLSRQERHARVRDEALLFFKKKEEFDSIALDRSNRAKLKELFSGSRVRDWAQLGEYWKGVKLVMEEVRRRLGGEEGIIRFLETGTEDDLKAIVLQVQADLGITAHRQENNAEDPAIALANSLEKTSLMSDSAEESGYTSKS
ncbi:hypothetical protein GALMADRAFT_238482 [Galerina marginata CBS 339.88]|uniref:Uncharacterized protein n=1 Tax=Galerina marginata (strain CBS 339.88) TaxID=685588 RepID=A0A067TI10_GALM3|nr:hypothetical protein GALMADRAFT_238482 [Galerina marginata CBS 339.88]